MSGNQITKTVDAGWRSRKLFIGVIFGGLVILLSSFLMLIAITGLWVTENSKVVEYLAQFEPFHWLFGLGLGLVFTGGCIGLISLDKVLDIIRECIPILKARFGIAPPPAGPKG